jgi:hypothetical protein
MDANDTLLASTLASMDRGARWLLDGKSNATILLPYFGILSSALKESLLGYGHDQCCGLPFLPFWSWQ